MNKKVFLLIQIFVLVNMLSISIIASNQPEVQVIDATTQQGSQTSVSIYLKDFSEVTALELIVIYDLKFIEYVSSNLNYTINQNNNVTVVTNTSVSGQIRIVLLSPEGLTYTGQLLNIQFKIKEETPINSYPIIGAIGEVYNLSEDSLQVSMKQGYIHVIEKNEFKNSVTYYESLSSNILSQDNTVTWRIYSYNLYEMTAGMYEVLYDSSVFELISVNFGNGFSNAVKDININTNGRVLLAFISSSTITQGNPILTIELKVKTNENKNTTLQFIPRQIYDQTLEPLGGNRLSKSVQTIETLPVVENKAMYVSSYLGKMAESVDIGVFVEANSLLSSGDFILTYNKNQLQLENIEIKAEGVFIVYDHDETNGILTFSVISTSSITALTELIQLTFKPQSEVLFKSTITLSGTQTYDDSLESIELTYKEGVIEFNGYDFQMGDMNQDGKLSVYDAVLMDLYLQGLINLTSVQQYLFDLNQDELLDINDLEYFMKMVLDQ